MTNTNETAAITAIAHKPYNLMVHFLKALSNVGMTCTAAFAGYTAEPDFLFLLRCDSGEAVHRIPIKFQAEYISSINDLLLTITITSFRFCARNKLSITVYQTGAFH